MNRKMLDGLARVPEPVRKPLAMLVVGLALLAPSGGMLMRLDGEAAGGAAISEVVEQAKASESPVTAAWARKAAERVSRAEAATFSRHFEIPLDLAVKIHAAAEAEGIAPEMAFGLVRTESAFDRRAVSYAGAVGYTQLLPSTARWMVPGTSRTELFETDTNLRIGFRYLNYLLEKYDGNERLALTAYNRGPGTVDRLLRRGRNPENGYATKVLSKKQGKRI